MIFFLCFQISIHYSCEFFFLQKQPIRAARKEGVIFFSLSLQTITKIMQTKEKKQTTLEVDRGMYQYLRQISGHGAGIPSRG